MEETRWFVYINPDHKNYMFHNSSTSMFPCLCKAKDENKQDCWIFVTHGINPSSIGKAAIAFNNTIMIEDERSFHSKRLRGRIHQSDIYGHSNHGDTMLTNYHALGKLMYKNRRLFSMISGKIYVLNCYNGYFNTTEVHDIFHRTGLVVEPYTNFQNEIHVESLPGTTQINNMALSLVRPDNLDQAALAKFDQWLRTKVFIKVLIQCLQSPGTLVSVPTNGMFNNKISLCNKNGELVLYVNEDKIMPLGINKDDICTSVNNIVGNAKYWCGNLVKYLSGNYYKPINNVPVTMSNEDKNILLKTLAKYR